MANERFVYSIHLRIDVAGPDKEWNDVADYVARKIRERQLPGGYEVRAVYVDAAADDPVEEG